MKILRYFILAPLILAFLLPTSAFGQKKTRAEKKKEKAELLDQGYESMKKLVNSGGYNFTAYREKMGARRNNPISRINDLHGVLNYLTIRNGECSGLLPPLSYNNTPFVGKISDMKIMEKDDNHTILVEFTIPDSIVKAQFTIMPGGKAELNLLLNGSPRLITYYGFIGPI